MTSAQPLLRFCDVLGIPTEEVLSAETPTSYSLQATVPGQSARALPYEALVDLASAYDDYFSLTIGLGVGPKQIAVHGASAIPTEADFRRDIGAIDPSIDYDLVLRIDKTALLLSLQPGTHARNLVMYLFQENLDRLLCQPLGDLDNVLFISSIVPTTVLVCDSCQDLQGKMLSILGFAQYADIRCSLTEPDDRTVRSIQDYLGLPKTELSWMGYQLCHITPVHFLCNDASHQESDSAEYVRRKLMEAFVAYTANRSEYRGKALWGTYTSPSVSTSVLTVVSAITTRQADAIARLVYWGQDSEPIGKLTLLQNIVARGSVDGEPQANYEALIAGLPRLLSEARWHYQVMVDEKINKTLEAVQTATEQIAGTTEAISEILDSTTKGLVDSFVAAVGVVILSLMAALAENEMTSTAFRVGMWVYAGYLLVFQVLYRMGYLIWRFLLVKSESDARIARYEAVLGGPRTCELAKPLRSRVKQYWWVSAITLALYLAVIVGVFVLQGWMVYWFPPAAAER